LTEGTFCKQSSQEPKIEELKEPEEMEEDKLLLHLVQPTSVGGLPHDSSNLNNVTGKRVQRKEARYFQLLNPEIFLVINLSITVIAGDGSAKLYQRLVSMVNMLSVWLSKAVGKGKETVKIPDCSSSGLHS
jgi:hypothetical protein